MKLFQLCCVLMVMIGCEKESPEPDVSGSGVPGASITASPNPVPLGSETRGTTTLRWDTGDGTVGQVYGSYNNKPEERIADNQTIGSKEFPWIDKGNVYTFRLYAGTNKEKVLATVKVTTE